MKEKIKRLTFKADSLTEQGEIEAVFSTFDIIDRDGDVVKASAIKDGKSIPMVWSHNWDMPIGRGTIHNDGKKATFKGKFFLETDWGRNAYESVKAMGDLQQYSWGFKVLKQEKGEQEGRTVNNILETEEFEVSPTLVGANPQTSTIGIKAHSHKSECAGDYCTCEEKLYVNASADGSYEELRDRLNNAFRDSQLESGYGYTYVVATYSDRFIACLWKWDDEEDTYWEVSYSVNESGDVLLGTPVKVEPKTEFVPVMTGQTMGYNQHSDYVQAAIAELLRRTKSGLQVRQKEGRAISAARRERMETVMSWLRDGANEIQAMLDETAPEEKTIDGTSLYAEYLRQISKELGVTV